MKSLYLCCLAACVLSSVRAVEYVLGPDSQPQAGVPKGTVTDFVLPAGHFFPGTPHKCSLYLPANHDASKPAPFMVFLDGNGARRGLRVPIVFDNLIARGELPPLIGIFIDPGVLPALSDRAQNRYERIFEYDSINDRFARFLIEEVIPAAESTQHVSLSRNPNDRGIAGSSTGGVGAFVAAWQRPDQFRRVYTQVGTFVDMKGAEELASLVRKTEAKPLRIFMQDGRNDHLAAGQPWGISFAGSWPINNQVMYEALEYAGYDVKFLMGDGGHDGKQGSAILPEVMRWLWRDYPRPIAVRDSPWMGKPGYLERGRVETIVSAERPWVQQAVSGGGEGPGAAAVTSVACGRDGTIFFADTAGNRIYQIPPGGGEPSVFKDKTEGATVLRAAPDGRLFASQPNRERIVAYDSKGNPRVVAQSIIALDLAVTARNEVYFTDAKRGTVGLIDAQGRVRPAYAGNVIASAGGLSLSPDQAMLVVTDRRRRFSWSFQIAADGSLINGEPFYRLYTPDQDPESGATGVTVDSTGQLYFATPTGIQIAEQNGRICTVLNSPDPTPAAVTAVALSPGEPAFLYAVAGKALWRRPAKIAGVSAWAPIKPPQPPL